MKLIQQLRRELELEHFAIDQVAAIVGSGAGLLSKLSRMTAADELVRVKRGVYVFGEEYRRKSLNFFALANLLHGPSYISLESALAHYGMIPERVSTYMSASIKSRKLFKSPVGTFAYRKIPAPAFALGVRSVRSSAGSFLIASKEKALLDKLYLDAPLARLGKHGLYPFIGESLRVESEVLRALSWKTMLKISEFYQSAKFNQAVLGLARILKSKNKN